MQQCKLFLFHKAATASVPERADSEDMSSMCRHGHPDSEDASPMSRNERLDSEAENSEECQCHLSDEHENGCEAT